jgi:hypothetical protein
MPSCKSCGAPIEFIKMESGKLNPVDAPGAAWLPMPGENVVVKIRGQPAFVMKAPTLEQGPMIEVFRSHFTTCPNAGAHRKEN